MNFNIWQRKRESQSGYRQRQEQRRRHAEEDPRGFEDAKRIKWDEQVAETPVEKVIFDKLISFIMTT